jgi:hypothetical protein
LDAYTNAPLCSTPAATCRAELNATVLGTRSTTGRSAKHYVTLSLPGLGQQEVTRSDDTGLFESLQQGTRVQAEVWQNAVVLLRGANGAMLATRAYPAIKVDGQISSGLLGLMLLPFFTGLAVTAAHKHARGKSDGLPPTSNFLRRKPLLLATIVGWPIVMIMAMDLEPYAHPLSGSHVEGTFLFGGVFLVLLIAVFSASARSRGRRLASA